MADLSLKHLSKKFGKSEVVHGITCDIQNGEFVVILGPSGCGKSTLLRLVAGLEEVTAGEVIIDGKVVNRLEPAERDIAMVFQNYALYPHMTVFKNMAYGLKIRRMPPDEIRKRVQEAARILELSDLLDRKPRELSGGQRQRVAMGRCIVREPKIFLFDEPLSNLDAKLRVQMRLEIRKLHEQLKVTSIYVTHDQVEAMTLGDRLIVMEKGYAAQIGTPLEVYQRPANIFVAGFIGSPAMNFLDGAIHPEGGSLVIEGAGRFDPEGGISGHRGEKVVVGIRPEHFETASDDRARLRLKVEHTEILGADTLVHGRFGNSQSLLTVRLPSIHHLQQHETLPLFVRSRDLHIFEKESGLRIE